MELLRTWMKIGLEKDTEVAQSLECHEEGIGVESSG